jgi:hypothetical protein
MKFLFDWDSSLQFPTSSFYNICTELRCTR